MLFSKNQTGEKLTFDGGWVELKPLSKGAKDTLQTRLTQLTQVIKGIDDDTLKKLQSGEIQEVPEFLTDVIKEINKVNYFKLASSIKTWSEDAPINEETVQELSPEIFDQLITKVDEMNSLTPLERKN